MFLKLLGVLAQVSGQRKPPQPKDLLVRALPPRCAAGRMLVVPVILVGVFLTLVGLMWMMNPFDLSAEVFPGLEKGSVAMSAAAHMIFVMANTFISFGVTLLMVGIGYQPSVAVMSAMAIWLTNPGFELIAGGGAAGSAVGCKEFGKPPVPVIAVVFAMVVYSAYYVLNEPGMGSQEVLMGVGVWAAGAVLIFVGRKKVRPVEAREYQPMP